MNMATWSSPRQLLGLTTFLALAGWCTGSYIITTPRKWTAEEAVHVCLFRVGGQMNPPTDPLQESVEVKVKAARGEEDIVAPSFISLPPGQTEVCQNITVPAVTASSGELYIRGNLGGKTVTHHETIELATTVSKTFVQTDKFLYMPGQKVQFRVLTIKGPYLKIFSGLYPEMWIESPSGSRIAQWINVSSPAGLIHEEFQLISEPEEGTYKIHVESPVGGTKTVQTFKVEDFVLPRFEVTLEMPPYMLASDTKFSYKVCATNTYGQPVSGNLTIQYEFRSYGNSRPLKGLPSSHRLSGCNVFEIGEDVMQGISRASILDIVGITATVTEDGTGQEAETIGLIDVQRTALNFKHVGKEDYVKPNLPFTGQFKVKLPSGASAINEPLTVCRGSDCKTYTTDSRGVVEYIYPKYEAFTIEISSSRYPEIKYPLRLRPSMNKPSSRHSVMKYYSPSNSSLVIKAPEVQLSCRAGEKQEFAVPVMFAASQGTKANFTIQLVSRGQIQYSHTQEYTLTETDLPIDTSFLLLPLPPPSTGMVRGAINLPLVVSLTSSPKAKVVVWYTRQDGEVVTDTQEIMIKKCLTNPVTLTWSAERAEPGEEVNLDVDAAPDSLCSLGVVDKRVELLSSAEDSLTLNGVFEVVERAMIGDSKDTKYDDDKYCRDQYPQRSIWDWLGLYYTDQVDAIKMFHKSGLFVFTDLKVAMRPCKYRESDPVWATSPVLPQKEHLPITRNYSPDTWLWTLRLIDSPTGNINQRLTLPHTITEWVGKAVCVHPEQGIGLSKKASITTFAPFFVELTLPPSVQRGEILPVEISVFNFLEEALPVRVVLASSEEYDIIEDPNTGLANGTRSSCIPSQEKVVHTVKVRPNALGDVSLTVEAFVDEQYPEACGSEHVISKRDHLIKPIRVELEGFPQEKTWTKYMCTSDTGNEEGMVSWSLQAPSNIVPDSTRGWVTAVGDLLGPTLENLGSLVKMPHRCGEQNMVNFAPNIYVMQYLEAAETTNSDIAEKIIKFMQNGYQRELRYRHNDGSFSAFGPSDESGSTWLTAFVLKSFAQAQQFIPIDTSDIDMSRDWLKRTQMENGCFLSKGKVFHKAMKGGIAGNDSAVPLTAYVLTSLLEAGELTVSKAVIKAAFCLVSDKTMDPYTLALKSYALSLAGKPEAATLMTQLLAMAKVTQEGMYWELPPTDGKSAAAGVEVASYAVLAMATLRPADYMQEMQKAVKWISSKRNGHGGFISTQDTVVALQALAKFEMVLGQKPVNVTVLTSSTGLDHTFRITDSNRLLQQQPVELPSFPTTVTVDVAGDGCALVQAVLHYNTPSEEPSTAFTLRTTTETAPDDTCVTKSINVCASYTLPDLKSNMAVAEINLVSGYIPDKGDLKQVVGNGTELIKRYEVDGRKVTFYIDEFSPEELCVAFRIKREVDVEKPKPGTVRVYDYYDPERFASESYTLPPSEECVDSSSAAA